MTTPTSPPPWVQSPTHAAPRAATTDAPAPRRDLLEHLTMYVAENPGQAALWCFGIGFVLGWRLKPW